jgi:DNA replication protein DnaC
MNDQPLERMRQMRMYGMADAFKTSLGTTIKETLPTDEFVGMLIDSEWDARQNRNITRLTKAAGFRYKASLEGVDYSIERGLDRNQINRLASLEGVDYSIEHADWTEIRSIGWPRSTSCAIARICSLPALP